MDILQIIIMPIVISLLAIKGNHFLDKKNNEQYKIRKNIEKEIIDDIHKNFNPYDFIYEFDGQKFNNNIDSKFEGLRNKIKVYLKNDHNKDLNEALKEYESGINLYMDALFQMRENSFPDKDGDITSEYKYQEKYFAEKRNVQNKLDKLHLVLNKIFNS